MKINSILKSTVLLSLAILLNSIVYADTTIFKPTFPDMSTYKTKGQQHRIQQLANATLANQVSIETYIASIPNPFDDHGFYTDDSACRIDDKHPIKCQFNYKLSANDAKKFKVMLLAGIGAVLMPTQWQVIYTGMGPSGIASATLASPNKDEAITIHNTSACAGCAMLNASLYFPEVKKLSLENEFGAIEDKSHALKIVKVNKNKVYFSYQIPNYPNKTHGIAFYVNEKDGGGVYNFQEIQVTLKPEHQSWAREILNFYQATH